MAHRADLPSRQEFPLANSPCRREVAAECDDGFVHFLNVENNSVAHSTDFPSKMAHALVYSSFRRTILNDAYVSLKHVSLLMLVK